MSKESIRRIVKPVSLPLREVWEREDSDFTPWLAENLDHLENLGLGDLVLEAIEVPLPSGRRLDILARTADNRRIAIENQYKAADHDHFTRGLAYAVNLQASALVIIAEGHGDEFITLADHLNRSAEILGDEGIPIFLVTLKVDEVGSNILPRFEVIAKPNKWRAEFITSEGNMAIESANRNASNRRGEFWDSFLTHVRQDPSVTYFANWTSTQRGSIFQPAEIPKSNLFFHINLRKDHCQLSLPIDTPDSGINDEIFDQLFIFKDEIEASLGYELLWERKEGVLRCVVLGQVIDQCGWGSEIKKLSKKFDELFHSYVQFRETLQPYLKGAFEIAVAGTP